MHRRDRREEETELLRQIPEWGVVEREGIRRLERVFTYGFAYQLTPHGWQGHLDGRVPMLTQQKGLILTHPEHGPDFEEAHARVMAALPDESPTVLDLGWIALVPKPFSSDQLTRAVPPVRCPCRPARSRTAPSSASCTPSPPPKRNGEPKLPVLRQTLTDSPWDRQSWWDLPSPS